MDTAIATIIKGLTLACGNTISAKFPSSVAIFTKPENPDIIIPFAPVAQWIRASVFGTEGRGFESLPVYQIIKMTQRVFFNYLTYPKRDKNPQGSLVVGAE